MPTIDFVSYNEDTIKNFKPVLASEVQPDWWKKSKVQEIVRGRIRHTIRSCPAMEDWLKMGYYIVSSRDIKVHIGSSDEDVGSEICFADDIEGGEYSSPSHPRDQFGEVFNFLGKDVAPVRDAFKMRNPWNITTPEGYSVFYLDPFLHQSPYFAVWPGILDTDTFNKNIDNAQVIFYPKVDHSFIIEKGTPLVQIIPFRREEWHATYQLRSHKSFIENLSHKTSPHGDSLTARTMTEWRRHQPEDDNFQAGPYRSKGYWVKKDKFFESMEECPFHKKEESVETQLEFDFDGS